uniref:Uncharacterized protein n=1 Tax=Vespula pensylvanica TaxID=30213 RepID=A0A834UD68_VESPE|nr:hypothetical protein H0235_004641 [Vespula pensylvanica]
MFRLELVAFSLAYLSGKRLDLSLRATLKDGLLPVEKDECDGVNTIESTFGRSLGFVINDDNNNNNNNNNNNDDDDDDDDDEDKDDHEQADVERSKRSGSCGKVVGKSSVLSSRSSLLVERSVGVAGVKDCSDKKKKKGERRIPLGESRKSSRYDGSSDDSGSGGGSGGGGEMSRSSRLMKALHSGRTMIDLLINEASPSASRYIRNNTTESKVYCRPYNGSTLRQIGCSASRIC